MKHKIFVVVDGGVADVVPASLPPNVEVEIVDLDNIRAGDEWPSMEAWNLFGGPHDRNKGGLK